jgi:phospholipase D1/2
LTLLNLRNCQTVNGQLRTEQIYVHTKLLIVDDRLVIVGSANINDRSLAGMRDSELAVLMTDLSAMDAPLDGKHSVKVRKLAHELRVNLWRKHFALHGGNDVVQPASELESMLDKPADPATWQAIQRIAAANLSAYVGPFAWVPGNQKSVWPSWPYGAKAERVTGADNSNIQNRLRLKQYKLDHEFGVQLERRMPFSKDFWKNPPAATKPAGIKGFICAIPLRWTEQENNHPCMNMILLTDNGGTSRDGLHIAANATPKTNSPREG